MVIEVTMVSKVMMRVSIGRIRKKIIVRESGLEVITEKFSQAHCYV